MSGCGPAYINIYVRKNLGREPCCALYHVSVLSYSAGGPQGGSLQPLQHQVAVTDLLPPIYQYERFRNRALFGLSEGPNSLIKRPNFKIIYNFLIKNKG